MPEHYVSEAGPGSRLRKPLTLTVSSRSLITDKENIVILSKRPWLMTISKSVPVLTKSLKRFSNQILRSLGVVEDETKFRTKSGRRSRFIAGYDKVFRMS